MFVGYIKGQSICIRSRFSRQPFVTEAFSLIFSSRLISEITCSDFPQSRFSESGTSELQLYIWWHRGNFPTPLNV
jgi:hypothetical protein